MSFTFLILQYFSVAVETSHFTWHFELFVTLKLAPVTFAQSFAYTKQRLALYTVAVRWRTNGHVKHTVLYSVHTHNHCVLKCGCHFQSVCVEMSVNANRQFSTGFTDLLPSLFRTNRWAARQLFNIHTQSWWSFIFCSLFRLILRLSGTMYRECQCLSLSPCLSLLRHTHNWFLVHRVHFCYYAKWTE